MGSGGLFIGALTDKAPVGRLYGEDPTDSGVVFGMYPQNSKTPELRNAL